MFLIIAAGKLRRLIESIPDTDRYTIIVVDDNSNKENFVFKAFLAHRTNVQVFHNDQNKGAGACRNIGLKNARGRWVMFADADDFFVDGAFEIIEEYINSKSDIVFFNAISDFENSTLACNRHENIDRLIRNYDKVSSGRSELLYRMSNPVCKLYSLSFAKDFEFDEVMYSNDVMFSLLTHHNAGSISVDIRPIYCITVSNGSLTGRITRESVFCRYQVLLRKNAYLRSVDKDEFQSCSCFTYCTL